MTIRLSNRGLASSTFSSNARVPGAARLPGFECVGGSSDTGRHCALDHRVGPTGPVDELSRWRQAWHAAYPFAIGGVR